MAITIHIHYSGAPGQALAFAREMEHSGTAAAIRQEAGNLCYRYYQPLDDPDTVLLIDRWQDQSALDIHHASPMMAQIAALREKYDLHMQVTRLADEATEAPTGDEAFLRR